MMYDLLKASVQLLNSLFNYTADRDNVVMWIRNKDYDKQLFISDTYESIWQLSCESIYNAPETWKERLIADDVKRIALQSSQRIINPSEDIQQNIIFYRIVNSLNEVKYVKDWCVPLLHQNQLIAITGAAEAISPERWHEELNRSLNSDTQTPDNQTSKYNFIDILTREFQLHFVNQQSVKGQISPKQIESFQQCIKTAIGCPLTPREVECCYYLCQGKTSKEIARITNLSFRTVEKYLDTARDKTGTSRRLTLINKLSKYYY